MPNINTKNSVNSYSDRISLNPEKIGTLSTRAIYDLTSNSKFQDNDDTIKKLKERLNELETKHESQGIIRRFFQRVKNRFSSAHLWETNKQLAEKALEILDSKGNNSQPTGSSDPSSEFDAESPITTPEADSHFTPLENAEPTEAEAQYNLGLRYEKGEGFEQSATQAFKWYKKAAEQGHIEAQWNLGFCYQHGRGIKKDVDESLRWCKEATKNEAMNAKKRLKADLPETP